MRQLRPVVLSLLAVACAGVAHAGDGTWTTTFPHGGVIRPGGLAVAGGAGPTLYALPLWRGVYRSDDGAGLWRSTTDDVDLPFDRTNVPWLAVGDEPDTLFVLAFLSHLNDQSLLRSRDGGRTWSHVGERLPGPLTAVAVDPADRRRLYVGTESGVLFVSRNRGDTWNSAGGVGLPSARVRRLVVDASAPNTVYAAFHGRGLFVSADAGLTWRRMNFGDVFRDVFTNLSDLAVHPVATGRLLAVGGAYGDGGPARMIRSEDGGVTWSDAGIAARGPAPDEPGRRIAVAAADPDVVLAVLGDDLWRSADGGLTWILLPFSHGRSVATAVADPDDPGTFYAGTTGGVYVTRNGGFTWRLASQGIRALTHVHSAAHGLAYDRSDPEVVYSGAARGPAAGAFRSTDGGVTWEVLDYPGEGVRSFVSHAAAPGAVLAYHNRVHRSPDRGDTWEGPVDDLCCGGGGDLRADPFDPAVLYLATRSGENVAGVYRSDDGGSTWRSTDGGRLGVIHTLAVDPVRRGTVYAATGETFPVLRLGGGRFEARVEFAVPGGVRGYARPEILTGDAGWFWFFDPDNVELVVKVLDGCPVNDRFWVFAAGLTNVEVRLVVTDTVTAAEAVYTGAAGRPFQPVQDTAAFATCDGAAAAVTSGKSLATDPLSGVFKTTDGGATWRALGGGLPPQVNVNQIVVHPVDPDLVLLGSATHNGGVYASRDGGTTWSLLLQENVNAVAVHPADPEVIYVGTWNTSGFYRSLDGGASWETINDGLPLRPGINALAVDPEDPLHLLAGTTAGVWEIDLPPPEGGP